MIRISTMADVLRQCLFGVAVAGLISLSVGCKSEQPLERRPNALEDVRGKTFTVFPAVVFRGGEITYDVPAAKAVANFARESVQAKPSVVVDPVDMKIPFDINSTKAVTVLVDNLKAHLDAKPIDTAYAIMPAYIIGSERSNRIYFILTNAQGDLVRHFVAGRRNIIMLNRRPANEDAFTEVLIEILHDRRHQLVVQEELRKRAEEK